MVASPFCFGIGNIRWTTGSPSTREGKSSARSIPLALLEAVLGKPDQVVPEKGVMKAYQSRCEIGGKVFLLRVIGGWLGGSRRRGDGLPDHKD
jgi:hypothetical protein